MFVLRKLLPAHRRLFSSYLGCREHGISTYAFENIFLWAGLYDVSWMIVDDNLCVFFRDTLGCFMYLPPLGRRLSKRALACAFAVMDEHNRSAEISRIENVEESDIRFFRNNAGYRVYLKGQEYLYKRRDMIELAGRPYKSKRSSVNYFLKHSAFTYRPFRGSDGAACDRLFVSWMKQRRAAYADSLYRGMLGDSHRVLQWLLGRYKRTWYRGIVVLLDNRIKAFTLGYALNSAVFCVLFEIADLNIKGLAQFIFRQFCSELEGYSHINVMDDSGLESLKKLKNSYKPCLVPGVYNVTRAS